MGYSAQVLRAFQCALLSNNYTINATKLSFLIGGFYGSAKSCYIEADEGREALICALKSKQGVWDLGVTSLDKVENYNGVLSCNC